MSDKPKFPAKTTLAVGERVVEVLKPVCSRIQIAGSLRRGKALVGDVEIVYVTEVSDARELLPGKLIRVNAADIIYPGIDRARIAGTRQPKREDSVCLDVHGFASAGRGGCLGII